MQEKAGGEGINFRWWRPAILKIFILSKFFPEWSFSNFLCETSFLPSYLCTTAWESSKQCGLGLAPLPLLLIDKIPSKRGPFVLFPLQLSFSSFPFPFSLFSFTFSFSFTFFPCLVFFPIAWVKNSRGKFLGALCPLPPCYATAFLSYTPISWNKHRPGCQSKSDGVMKNI